MNTYIPRLGAESKRKTIVCLGPDRACGPTEVSSMNKYSDGLLVNYGPKSFFGGGLNSARHQGYMHEHSNIHRNVQGCLPEVLIGLRIRVRPKLQQNVGSSVTFMYLCIHIHAHTHIHTYIYIYVYYAHDVHMKGMPVKLHVHVCLSPSAYASTCPCLSVLGFPYTENDNRTCTIKHMYPYVYDADTSSRASRTVLTLTRVCKSLAYAWYGNDTLSVLWRMP